MTSAGTHRTQVIGALIFNRETIDLLQVETNAPSPLDAYTAITVAKGFLTDYLNHLEANPHLDVPAVELAQQDRNPTPVATLEYYRLLPAQDDTGSTGIQTAQKARDTKNIKHTGDTETTSKPAPPSDIAIKIVPSRQLSPQVQLSALIAKLLNTLAKLQPEE